ncbi:P-loop NTPase fold protein [Pseudomonas sp. lyk4-R2A-10]|uniref:KAP family P-loop NTPase fold protein n=1 Tax=Pseudomonas sp. lyk4-R2A-10 TaxID=3040315 RepID=UPI0025533CCD|nr:P-loop NTPase fold protein [Pseudomonas sp. lyk4-R2A-10]
MSETNVWGDDFMERAPSARFLTSYLLANPHIKVLNVNSPWGAGKSFFLNRWRAELGKEHVCIFFNAWESDYSAEPLVALITCIEQQTMDGLSLGSTSAGKNVIKTTTTLMRKAAPLIAKGLVKKFSGVEIDEILGKDSDEQAGEIAKGVVEDLIKEQSKTETHVEEFKCAILEKLSNAATNFNLKKPAFIFIDELDRCRPTYAIELLERVKHFFELEDCRFIVASDSTQLAHSVRAVYGEKFSSERYLGRFFDAEFRLDNTNIFGIAKQQNFDYPYVRLQIRSSGVAGVNGKSSRVEPKNNTIVVKDSEFPQYALILVGMARYFKVELREMIRYAQQIKSMASALPEHEFHYFWAAYLIFSKSADESLYQALAIPEKASSAIDNFDGGGAVPVNFAFPRGHETIADIAKFYARILHATQDEFNGMVNNSEGWRQSVIYGVNDNKDIFLSYRKIVELAHQIS